MNPPLLTSRCILRPVEDGDAAVLWDALQQPDFRKGLVYKTDIQSLKDAEVYTAWHAAAWKAGQAFFFSIVSQENNQCIGRMGIGRRPDNHWHLAYWVHPIFQRNGYAKECLPIVLSYVFTVIGVDELHADCHSWNSASKQLLTSCMMPVGEQGDRHIFTLTQKEWFAGQAA